MWTWILIVIIIYLASKYYQENFINTKLSMDSITSIYDLLQHITCAFDKNGIEYSITGGTLLGAVRHSGMIPWDDDGDIVVFNRTPEETVRVLQSELSKWGINAFIHPRGNILNVVFEGRGGLIDVFFMSQDPYDSKFKYHEPFGTQYPNEWFYHHELYPLREYTFGPLKLKGPNDAETFLNRGYGYDWKIASKKWTTFRRPNENVVYDNDFRPVLPVNLEIRKCDL